MFDQKNNRFKNYVHNQKEPNSINDDRIRTIFTDSNDIIWIGTESGVDKIVQQNNFQVFKKDPDDKTIFPEGIVCSIIEDENEDVWFGIINKSLLKYNAQTKQFKKYDSFISKSHQNAGKHVTSIYQDSNKDIWVGDWDSGLFKYDRKRDNFIHLLHTTDDSTSISDNRIKEIIESKPGYLWIGTESGLNYYDVKNNTCVRYLHDPDNPNSLSGNALQSKAMAFDSKGNLWVGLWSEGLNKISFEKNQEPVFTNWRNDPDEKGSLNNNNVISLYIDQEDIVWLGTFGGGLNRFDPATETFKNLSTADGLPNNIIFSIIEDHSNNLWLSTDGGISKLNLKNNTFNNFYKSDGLQSDHFFWGSSHKGESGMIYFGGIEGFNRFHPDSIHKNISPSAIHLLDFKVLNEVFKSNIATSHLKTVELSHKENFLTFEYTALNYTNPNRYQYQYKMDGVDENWYFNGERRFTNYTNLNPGNYIFRVKTSKNIGEWDTEELQINIIIKSPWWQTWWAKISFILIFVGSILAFYFIRVGILQTQKRKLEIQVKLRTLEIEKSNAQLELQKNELYDKNAELHQTLDQLEQTQKALIDSEKMASIGILSAGMAHEINNPLNFISVSLLNLKTIFQQLQEEKLVDEENSELMAKLFQHSDQGIKRISNIIKSLKSYVYKGEGNKLVYTNINEQIKSSLTLLKSKIPNNLEIKLKLENIPLCKTHPDQISQVLLNIIDNAIDACSNDSSNQNNLLKINTEKIMSNGIEQIKIEVFNTGHPIDKSIIKHIFDPFYTTKSPNEGTGLGLYISYNIIKEHKGDLIVENKDRGVVFRIILPIK